MNRKVLVVGAGDGPLSSLAEALARSGFEVGLAPDGFYAALQLERLLPAAVLTATRLPDMEARELAEILSTDPALDAVMRILLVLPGEELPAGGAGDLFDLVLPMASPAPRLVGLLAAALAPGAGRQAGEAGLSGSLAAVDFCELTQALERSCQTGLLRVLLPEGEGRTYFSRGQVVHCAFEGLQGAPAFTALLWAAQTVAEARFRFDPLSTAEVFRQPRTVAASVQSLLLTAATEIDESLQRASPSSRGGSGGG